MKDYKSRWRARMEKRHNKKGHIWGGLLLLLVGLLLFMRQLGYYFPEWFFSWEMMVIGIGIFIGAKNGFRDWGWLIVCAVGFFFLADDIWEDIPLKKFMWPAIIAAIGLFMILRPRHKICWGDEKADGNTGLNAGSPGTDEPREEKIKEDVLDEAAIFGSIKKVVYSKNFRGGELVAVFGGNEINLTMADFEKQVKIEIVNVFGGTTLIIPPNWQVRSEAAAVFGGIEDKRVQHPNTNPDKILVIEGFVMFGGIEIKSY